MRRIITSVTLILLWTAWGLPSTATDDIPDYVGYHLQEANRLRAERGLPPFAYNDQLAQAAVVQSEWMIDNWSYAHYHGGSTPTTRAIDAGYSGYDWCCTENTFLSPTTTPEGAMGWWMKSPPHERQLMSDEYDEIGVGYSIGSARTAQVIVFGRRNPLPDDHPAATPAPETTEIIKRDKPTKPSVPAEGCAAEHRVSFGENLFRIGLRYGFSAQQLAVHNDIADVTRVYAGQRLCIPPGGTTSTASTLAPNPNANASDNAAPTNTDNWCYPGNPWGDGRCQDPDPAVEHYMWRCGWYKAQGIPNEACN